MAKIVGSSVATQSLDSAAPPTSYSSDEKRFAAVQDAVAGSTKTSSPKNGQAVGPDPTPQMLARTEPAAPARAEGAVAGQQLPEALAVLLTDALGDLREYEAAAERPLAPGRSVAARQNAVEARKADVASKVHNLLEKLGSLRDRTEDELRAARPEDLDQKAQTILAQLQQLAREHLSRSPSSIDRSEVTKQFRTGEPLRAAVRAAKDQVSSESPETRRTAIALSAFRPALRDRQADPHGETAQVKFMAAVQTLGDALVREYTALLSKRYPNPTLDTAEQLQQLKTVAGELAGIHPALRPMIDEIRTQFEARIKHTAVGQGQLQSEMNKLAKLDPRNPKDVKLSDIEQGLLEKGDATGLAFLKAAGVKIENTNHKLSLTIGGTPVTLSALEQQLASEPLVLAALKLGKVNIETTPLNLIQVTIDGNRVALNADEQTLAQENQTLPLAMSLLRQAKLDPKIVSLIEAMPAIRLASTKARIAALMAGEQPNVPDALKILGTNLDAASSLEERAQLWREAGEPYFNQPYFERQIAQVVARSGHASFWNPTNRADEVGKWMQTATKDAPAELAAVVLDAVKAQYRPDWTAGTMDVGVDFYMGLSQAVERANLLPHTDRTQAIAAWLTDPSEGAPGRWLPSTLLTQLSIDGLPVPSMIVGATIGQGHGARLSKAIAEKLENESDRKWLNAEVERGIRNARTTESNQILHAKYLEFNQDPKQPVGEFFDAFLKLETTWTQLASDDVGLRNRIGIMLRKQPNTQAAEQGDYSKEWFTDPRVQAEIKLVASWIVHAAGSDKMTVNAIPFVYGGTDDVRTSALFEVKSQDGKTTRLIDGSVASIEVALAGDKSVDPDAATIMPYSFADFEDFREKNKLSKDELLYLPKNFLKNNRLTNEDRVKFNTDGPRPTVEEDRSYDYPKSTKAGGPASTTSATMSAPTMSVGNGGHAEWGSTRAGVHTLAETAKFWANVSVGVVATGAGIVLAVPSGGTSLAAGAWGTILVASAWGVGMSVDHMVDMSRHGQTLNPMRSSEAFDEYVSLVGCAATALSFGAMVRAGALANGAAALRYRASMTMGYLAPAEREALRQAERAANIWNRTAKGISLVNFPVGGYQMIEQAAGAITNFDQMTSRDWLAAGLSVAEIGASTWMQRRSNAPNERHARNRAICETCAAPDSSSHDEPQLMPLARRSDPPADQKSFWPNPNGPRDATLAWHEWLINKGFEGPLRLAGRLSRRSYDATTYEALYAELERDNPAVVAGAPRPGTFEADQLVRATAEVPGGVERIFGDYHFHLKDYAGRLGLTVENLLATRIGARPIERIAGAYARIRFGSIPECCSEIYYAAANTAVADMRAAKERDRLAAEGWLAAYARDPAQAAHFDLAVTAYDFRAGNDNVAHAKDMMLTYPQVYGLSGAHGEMTVGFVRGRPGKEHMSVLKEDAPELDSAEFRRFLAFANEHGLSVLVHMDAGGHPLTPAGRPNAGRTAAENVPHFIRLLQEYPRVRIVWAHGGVGNHARPDPTPVPATVTVQPVRFNWTTGEVEHVGGPRELTAASRYIHQLYQFATQVPNAWVEFSWDTAVAALRQRPFRDEMVTFIMDHPDRVLLGTDNVKPVNFGHYTQSIVTALPLLKEIAMRPGSREVLWKILRGNYEKHAIMAGRGSSRWTRNELRRLGRVDDARLTIETRRRLASERSTLRHNARREFDQWYTELTSSALPSWATRDLELVAPGGYEWLKNHRPPAVEQEWQPEGRRGPGTSGGLNNASPSRNMAAAGGTGAVAGMGAVLAETLIEARLAESRMSSNVEISWNFSNAAAFASRAAADVIANALRKKRRLDSEAMVEEGHAPDILIDRAMGLIFNNAKALGLSKQQLFRIGTATEQFRANYSWLRDLPVDETLPANNPFGWTQKQKFQVIMQEIGRWTNTLTREMGFTASSIDDFDARFPLGQALRTAKLMTYVVNDAVTARWFAEYGLGWIANGPEPLTAEGAFRLFFGIGNGLLTLHTAASLASGRAGVTWDNADGMRWLNAVAAPPLVAGGLAWSAYDTVLLTNALATHDLGAIAMQGVKAGLDWTYTRGMMFATRDQFRALRSWGTDKPVSREYWPLVALSTLALREALAMWSEGVLAPGKAQQPASGTSDNDGEARRNDPYAPAALDEFLSKKPRPPLMARGPRVAKPSPPPVAPHPRVAATHSRPLDTVYLPQPSQLAVNAKGGLRLHMAPTLTADFTLLLPGTSMEPTGEPDGRRKDADNVHEWVKVRSRAKLGNGVVATVVGWVRQTYAGRGPAGSYKPREEGVHAAHVVQPGDTMQGIKNATGDSLRRLKKLNPGIGELTPGQKIYY